MVRFDYINSTTENARRPTPSGLLYKCSRGCRGRIRDCVASYPRRLKKLSHSRRGKRLQRGLTPCLTFRAEYQRQARSLNLSRPATIAGRTKGDRSSRRGGADEHSAAIREDHVPAYQRAAEAILKRAQNATAFADMPLTGRIPLPRRRPPQRR
jgi:hypothetical protein